MASRRHDAEQGFRSSSWFRSLLLQVSDTGHGRPDRALTDVPAGAGLRTRALAIPAWFWLAGIVVVSIAVRVALARRIVAPWIMIDEIVYSELAKSFASSGHFLVRDVPSHGYGFVYPVLIAPAWRVFGAVPDAYAAAKAINAVVMSLAAIPAYFLARRLFRPPLALVAAAAHGARPFDALHRHADDRERVLPAVPRRRARAGRDARAPDRRCASSCCSRWSASPTRHGRRPSRCSPRPRRRRCCSRSSSGGACAAGCGRSRRSTGSWPRARSSPCSAPSPAAARRSSCSAPTAPRRRATTA